MRKISFIAVLLLCFITLLACNKSNSGACITFAENGALTAQISTEEAGTLKIPAPAGTQAQYCIGWYSQNGNTTVFLPIGASYDYQAGEVQSFAPLYLHLTTHSTATLDMTVAGGGISFSTDIVKADWRNLIAVTANVSYGTLIYPSAALPAIGGTLTHAALQAAEKTATDIPSSSWLVNNETTLSFGATLTDILDHHRLISYTAVGYIKIVYTNDTSSYIYASYTEETPPAHSVCSLAMAAKNDLSPTQTDHYKYAVGNSFSPYTEADRATIDQLAKVSISMLVNQTTSPENPGKYLLDPIYTNILNARLVRDNDADAAEWQELYQAIGDTRYSDGGAIVITCLDGTPLNADVISGIIMRNVSQSGTIEVEWSKYIFYNGALVVPYSVYARPSKPIN